MLRLEDISISYGNKTIISHFSFDFSQKAVYAVVGKSGSGKSTLLKAIASSLPHSGQVLWGHEILQPKLHRIALVPQGNGLVPWKTVAENISLPLQLRGEFHESDMLSLCEELGISHLLSSYPGHISGGERQRTAMARAFLMHPHVLLLDESFSALDAITREEVHQVFLRAFQRHPVTTVMVTHDIAEALTLAQYLLIFKEGKIKEIIENPRASEAEFPLLVKEIKKKL